MTKKNTKEWGQRRALLEILTNNALLLRRAPRTGVYLRIVRRGMLSELLGNLPIEKKRRDSVLGYLFAYEDDKR